MSKKSVSSQTGRLKIGRKDEILARKEKMLSLPCPFEDSTLSFNACKFVKIFRVLLTVNVILSLALIAICSIHFVYFDNCIMKTFGPIITNPTKLYFLVICAETFFLSIFGLFATVFHVKNNIISYMQFLLLSILVTLSLTVWYYLHKTYLTDASNYKSKDVCTLEEQKCWDTIHKTFKCCGWDGAENWPRIPLSCCNKTIDGHALNCSMEYIEKNFAYSIGCYNVVNDILRVLYLVAISISALALIIFVISLLLANRIAN